MIDKIYAVGRFSIVHIRDTNDGKHHRRTLSPGSDISNEPPEVKAACNKAWTPEVVEAYRAHMEAAI